MAAVLDQAALQINREREASQPRTPLLLLPDLLRNAIVSLALALAAGCGAGSRGSRVLKAGLQVRLKPLLDRAIEPCGSGGSVLIKAASAVHLAPVAHTDHLHHLHHQHLI